MKKSEIVEKLKENNLENPIKSSTNEKKIGDPNWNQVNKAYQVICTLWNKDSGSRNFIKHLIVSFLPIDPLQRRMFFTDEEKKNKVNTCCILGIKVAGITEISEGLTNFMMTKMRLTAAALSEKREFTVAEKNTLETLLKKLPAEIRYQTQAFVSDKSSKIISQEAVLALREFTTNGILWGERDIEFTIKKYCVKEAQKSVKKEKRLKDSEVNRVIKASTYRLRNCVNEDTLDKLIELKKELGEK